MPFAVDSDGAVVVTTSQVAAWQAAQNQAGGNQTAQEQTVVTQTEAAISQIAQGWTDSGGPGGHQQEAALRVLDLAGRLEAARLAAINQHADKAQGGTLQARYAQSEMHGADTQFIIELARSIYELEARLNDSPY